MLGKSLTEVIHETAKDLYNAGGMSEQTMREFEELLKNKIKPQRR